MTKIKMSPLLVLSIIGVPVYGAEASTLLDPINLIISTILLLQAFLILVLQRNRLRYKRARQELKESQRLLERKVLERTQVLSDLNEALQDEVIHHRETSDLLRQTQSYLDSIINSMPSQLIGVTDEGVITHWNSAAACATGITADAALDHPISQVLPDSVVNLEQVKAVIASQQPESVESYRLIRSNHIHYADITIYPLKLESTAGAVILIEDVTLRVRVENMLIQSEKMHSLGELAAGMAHELNNPLSAILHGVQNIQRRFSTDLPANDEVAQAIGINLDQLQAYLRQRDIYAFLDGIREAGDRSAAIVRNMLEFSRTSFHDYKPVAITELIDHSLDLASKAQELLNPQGGEVAIVRQYEPGLATVNCVAGEIQQVLINLFRNACQSFSQTHVDHVPTITVRAYHRDGEVCIEVEDNGCGMQESVRKHVFEPFFTTKEAGKGTGLGLAVTYFIITEHHEGAIDVISTEGKGSLFRITLPID